jgi:hypothetical protein
VEIENNREGRPIAPFDEVLRRCHRPGKICPVSMRTALSLRADTALPTIATIYMINIAFGILKSEQTGYAKPPLS